MHSRYSARVVNQVVNMTNEPIRLYEDQTGEIMTFYPSMRRFCQIRNSRLFPRNACYVFSQDMAEDMRCFSKHFTNVAVAINRGHGRDGLDVFSLIREETNELFVFRRKIIFES